MEIVVPKKLATEINNVLFDGMPYSEGGADGKSVEINENATHTRVSLAYGQDFRKIELQAVKVTPEFSSVIVLIAAAMVYVSIVLSRSRGAGNRL
ncbi:MAG: hypothetical protein ACREBU_08585 [Nitrososphaera sp.]